NEIITEQFGKTKLKDYYSTISTISTCPKVVSLTEDDEPKSKQAKLDSASLHKECFSESGMTCFGRRSEERILLKYPDLVKPLLLPNAVLANWVQQGLLSFELVVIGPILAFDLTGSH
ncbi:hypothetical protein WA026_023050, partial [Henosepilachna vigintioctopunctata]